MSNAHHRLQPTPLTTQNAPFLSFSAQTIPRYPTTVIGD